MSIIVDGKKMAEEIGELAVALRSPDIQEDIIDAMGDILIYSIDFARRDGIDWVKLQEKASTSLYYTSRSSQIGHQVSTPHGFLAALDQHFGKLCHHYLKRHQGIRKNEDHPEGIKMNLMFMIRDIELYCVMHPMYENIPHQLGDELPFKWSLKRILFTTAGTVLKRDWTSEQLGGSCLCPTDVVEDDHESADECPVHGLHIGGSNG